MSSALLLLAMGGLILVNGFFVAAEFALVRSSRSRLQDLADDGSAPARRALALHEDMNQYLSSCQVGITLASLGIGFLGEPALARLFEPLFGEVVGHGASVALALALAYIVATASHITVGEQVPKIASIVHPERTTMLIARPLRLFTLLLGPFVSMLTAVSNAMLRLIRIDPGKIGEDDATPEELRILIAQARAGGTLDAGEAGMLSGVFHLHEQDARQVMTPIPAVVTVDLADGIEAALRRCISSGHTRLLVIEDDNRDKVRGIIHSNSLASALLNEGPEAEIEPLVRDAVIVPETRPLDDLLADLQRNRATMAVVVDEYGRVSGIVTIEDIIEEVVGEIDDETDPAGGQVRRLANGDWYVRGHVAVTDLLDHGLELPADPEDYTSVGGLVFTELGRLPQRGDVVSTGGYAIRVESVRENRIEAVRISERRGAGGSGS